MGTTRNSKTKISGILTSGGDYPGLNASKRGGTILGSSREKPFKQVKGNDEVAGDKVEAIKETYRMIDSAIAVGT